MIDFLKGSKTFGGICFVGHYDMPLDHFEILYNHYQKTGENLLDSYSNVVYTSWEENDDREYLIDGKKFNEMTTSVLKMRRLNLFDSSVLDMVLRISDDKYQRYLEFNSRKLVRRRANGYTSKKEIRQHVIDTYGDSCLCCGSGDDLQIDHIVPVSMGGENNIDNLQPLCKGCNIKKGTKNIDYRPL